MRRGYNPYLLPKWLRKTRKYCKQIIIPICVFQGVRIIILPTTGDVVVFCLLCCIAYLLLTDFI